MLTDFCSGYDVVYVDDISQTTSPSYAINMTRYNAQGYGVFPRMSGGTEADLCLGFLGNSTAILKALG
jgi:hypothetical protein